MLWDALTVTYSSGKDKLQTFDLHVKANGLKQNGAPEILRWDLLPIAEAAYAAIRKKTAHQNILEGTQQGVTSGVKLTDDLDGIWLISKGRRSDQKFNLSSPRIDKTKLKCENCGVTKHIKEQCFEIVGYPDWWVGNKKGKSGKVAAAVGSQETIDSGSGSNTHQKELETPSTSREVNMETSGKKNASLIFDYGATDTMTYEISDICAMSKPQKSRIHTANGETLQVEGGGTIQVSQDMKLSNCLYDIQTGKIIGRGTERQGLYYVDEVVTQQGTVMLAHGSTSREAWLWH
nr:putative ribonuclease H-like domain-containing protein [Tanacetum cinerariifolium]